MAVKALIHRISGTRIEGDELTPLVRQYAETNPDNFKFIYSGPEDDQAEAIVPESKSFTASQLRRMSEGAVLDAALNLGLVVDDTTDKAAAIEMILAKQAGV